MSKITVNGATLEHDILGQGSAVVFTPGGLEGIKVARPFAEPLSSRYQILIYDPRNCGASDVVIGGDLSEFEIWADDLHTLLNLLGMSPTYVCGGSGGGIVSLMLTQRHPEDVKGLLFISPPTDDIEIHKIVAHDRYFQSADLAESNGMQAVVESSLNWAADWPQRIEQNPANRKRLLSMDVKEFAVVMRQWGTFLTSGRWHFGGLTDEMLHNITTPTLIISGMDDVHPQDAAERLHGMLPNSELVLSADVLSPREMERLGEWIEGGEGWRFDTAFMPILDKFMQMVETEQY